MNVCGGWSSARSTTGGPGPSGRATASGYDGLVSCIDTLFRCLSNGDWAFYTADSQRRESLSSAARACPGAVLEESLTLRPRRMHLP